MSDFRKFRKGVAYSVIAIVALIGILGVLGAISYQSSIGSGVADTSSQKADQDISTNNLELTKAMVIQDVKYSTLSALLDVTKNGGTSDPETYWECDNVPQPVTPDEFTAAISNVSLPNMQSYVQALKSDPTLAEKSISVSDPDCMTVSLPDISTCNSLNCEQIGSGIQSETIDVASPVNTVYKGPLNVNDVGPTRAANTLRVLDDLFSDNKVLQIISSSMADNCPQSAATKFKIAYGDLCKEIVKELDPNNPEYIICNVTEIPTPHTSCMRQKKTEICAEKASLAGGNDKAILIHIEDLKYEPLGDGTHMQWNLKMVFTLDDPECTPIDKQTQNY